MMHVVGISLIKASPRFSFAGKLDSYLRSPLVKIREIGRKQTVLVYSEFTHNTFEVVRPEAPSGQSLVGTRSFH